MHGHWHARESAEPRPVSADFSKVEIIKAHPKRKMTTVQGKLSL
jgi:hypothetical protein